MGLLDSIIGGIGGLSSIVGVIQSNQARAKAQAEQQAALNQYAQANDAQYQNLLGNQNRTLMGMAGQGGDAIRNLGANLGSSLAGAGVWNSSATAGALQGAQRDENTALANLAAENYYNANQFHNQGLSNLAQMRLGQANTNYGYANQDLGGARQGLAGFLGSLAQTNLSRSGANPYRTQLPSINGTVNQGANLGGNAGGIGHGGDGAQGTPSGGSVLGGSLLGGMPTPRLSGFGGGSGLYSGGQLGPHGGDAWAALLRQNTPNPLTYIPGR